MRVETPSSREELRRCAARGPEGLRYLAGGTDLVVHLRAHPEERPPLVDLSGVPELREIRPEETPEGPALRIGAAATFSDLERHPLVVRHAAALARAAASVGSPQIRNRATLGGNVANASPAADSLPALACLGARALVEPPEGQERPLPLDALIAGPGRSALEPRALLTAFWIPLGEGWSSFHKLGSRRAVSISRVNLALWTDGRDSRLFLGALGALPVRCPEGESALALRGEARRAALEGALVSSVETAIPGRSSLAYKRDAVRGLGADLCDALEEAGR